MKELTCGGRDICVSAFEIYPVLTQTLRAIDEQGNRRVGGMTDAEAQQCVRDIIAWFKRSSDLEISEGSEESMQPLIKSLGEAL